MVVTMRIEVFLKESPMFAVSRAARRFDALAAETLAADKLSFMEGMVLAAIFFESPAPVKPSQLAETFGTTRGNVSHCLTSLESKGLVQRRIDPEDARAFLLTLKPSGKRSAVRVIGAFDKLQHVFERALGKTSLRQMLKDLRSIEAVCEEA